MKRLSTLMIILGLIIISIPICGRIYMAYQQHQLMAQYEADLSALGSSDMTVSEDLATDGAISGGALDVTGGSVSAKKLEGVIGRIKIPSIKSDLLLLQGSGSKQLRYGAGHVSGTAFPGKTGNCAIAAHRNYTFGSYFSRLGEVKNGDKVTVEYEGSTFTYTVYDSFLVLPKDTYVLSQPKDTKQLTLITCAPKGSNTHRLIVRGVLEGYSPPANDPRPKSDDGSGSQTSTPAAAEGATPDTEIPSAPAVNNEADAPAADSENGDLPTDAAALPGDGE